MKWDTFSHWDYPKTSFVKDQTMHVTHLDQSMNTRMPCETSWFFSIIPSKHDSHRASFRWPFRQQYTEISHLEQPEVVLQCPPVPLEVSVFVRSLSMNNLAESTLPFSRIIYFRRFSINKCKKSRKQLYIEANQWEGPQFWRFQLLSPR